MRILVVEDAKDLNRLIVKVLVKNGYSVDGCFNGEEALEYLAGAEYDAMLLDVMMPKLDGFSLLERLRNAGNEIPVLVLTAKDAISDRVKGLDLGADDYLIKPFDFDELLARIRNMTRKRSGSRSNRNRWLQRSHPRMGRRIHLRLRSDISYADENLNQFNKLKGPVGYIPL